jgi:hypothetical protein
MKWLMFCALLVDTVIYSCKIGITDNEFRLLCAAFIFLSIWFAKLTCDFIQAIVIDIFTLIGIDLLLHVYLNRLSLPIR